MTDRELLELAAKAAGIVGSYSETHPEFGDDWVAPGVWYTDEYDCTTSWNPLDNDGDALRLAVRLNIGIAFCFHRQTVTAGRWHALHEHRIVPFGQDKEAATRLAVVHSAAAIGKDMP